MHREFVVSYSQDSAVESKGHGGPAKAHNLWTESDFCCWCSAWIPTQTWFLLNNPCKVQTNLAQEIRCLQPTSMDREGWGSKHQSQYMKKSLSQGLMGGTKN